MYVMVKEVTTTSEDLGRYTFVELTCGRHEATVVVAADYIRVIVKNASNRAWRGMGKQFANVADAVANYKTGEVRAMIETAASLAA